VSAAATLSVVNDTLKYYSAFRNVPTGFGAHRPPIQWVPAFFPGGKAAEA